MFGSNKREDAPQGDYVTRNEAQSALSAYVTREDAQSALEALAALEQRVRELETLASELRRSGGVQARGSVTDLPRRAAGSDALTKTEAHRALDALRQEGASAFAELGRKVDALARTAQRSSTATTSTPTAPATGVDYGAVAFGLSQIKRDVAGVVGDNARSADLAAHYRQTVQYFADVFAKSDGQFDADLFKSQAGA